MKGCQTTGPYWAYIHLHPPLGRQLALWGLQVRGREEIRPPQDLPDTWSCHPCFSQHICPSFLSISLCFIWYIVGYSPFLKRTSLKMITSAPLPTLLLSESPNYKFSPKKFLISSNLTGSAEFYKVYTPSHSGGAA